MTTPPTPAGWYPDTEVPGGLRYWDGISWTEHRTPPAAPAVPAASPVAEAMPLQHPEPKTQTLHPGAAPAESSPEVASPELQPGNGAPPSPEAPPR